MANLERYTPQELEVRKHYAYFEPGIKTCGHGYDYGLMRNFCSNPKTLIIDVDGTNGPEEFYGTLERNGYYYYHEVKPKGADSWANEGQARYWLPIAREGNKFCLIVQSTKFDLGRGAFLFEPTRFAALRKNFSPTKDLITDKRGNLHLVMENENDILANSWRETDVDHFRFMLGKWWRTMSDRAFYEP